MMVKWGNKLEMLGNIWVRRENKKETQGCKLEKLVSKWGK